MTVERRTALYSLDFAQSLCQLEIKRVMAIIKLQSSEGTEFTVEREIAERSILLKNMLDDVGESDMGM